MSTPATVVAGVDFGDAGFAATVRDGVARVEQLMDTELRGADDVMTDSLLHLFLAGGKRFRPLFTVLAGADRAASGLRRGDDGRRGHRDGAPGDAVPRRRDGRGGSAPRRTQRQRALGQQRRHPGRRLSVRDGVATGVAAGTRGGAADRRDVRPAGDRADARDPRRRRGGGFDRALPEGGAREDGLPDRCGRPVRRHVLRRRRRAVERLDRLGGLVGTAFQISDDIIDIDSESDESGKVPGTDLREGVHTLPMLYALAETGPEGARLRELLVGPITDDAEVPRR